MTTLAATKRGFLTKEGGGHKNWKKRWCVLAGNTLLYYKSAEDTEVQGTVYLEEFKEVVVSQNRPKVPFCFEIVPVEDNGRTYFFAAEAESEMNNWIAAIDTILEAIRNTELRQKRAYVTVEVGLLSGLRISGDLPVVIARELSDLEDVPSDAKRIDERGWYVDEYFTVERVLSVFSKFNWHLDNMYESTMIMPKIGYQLSSQAIQQPANFLIFWLDLMRRQAAMSVLREPSRYANRKVKPPMMIPPTQGFRVEDGVSGRMFKGADDLNTATVENPESENAWYRLYFVNREHQHFISDDRDDPFVMSVIREVDQQSFYQYRVIVWLRTGNEQLTIPVQEKETLTPGQILEIAAPQLAGLENTLRHVSSTSPVGPDLAAELIKMENEQCNVDFKFGVVYCKKGQSNQDEIFGNESSSPEFDEFLGIIGDRIQLKGWTGYRGGLSNKESEVTGKESVFTKFDGYNIMFHVSTLLPYNANDLQQLERKRHVGNDIVTIVFQDEPGILFSPLTISSHFLHIFVVIERMGVVNGAAQYRMNVCTNEKVPPYGPQLPYPATWNNPEQFRQFLLAKMLNAEKAAYKAPAFMTRRKRTLSSLLQLIQDRFLTEAKKGVASRRLNQEAQVSRRMTSDNVEDGGGKWLLKPESQSYQDVLSGGVWENKLLLGTSEGLAIVSGEGDHSEDFRPAAKPRKVTRVRIVDYFGLVLTFESKSNSQGYVYSYDLPSLERGNATGTKITETKNTTVFDLRVLEQTSELVMVYVVKRQLMVSVWQPARSIFAKIKEYTLQVEPTLLQFVDDDFVFLASTAGFVRLSLKDGNVQPIPLANQPSKIDPVSIVPLGQEVLLSYNALSYVVSPQGKQTRDIVFKWSATPLDVVFLNPVVVGVTNAQIEVRSLLNGNLLETKSCMTSHVLGVRATKTAFNSQLFVASPNSATDGSQSSTQILRFLFGDAAEL